MNALASDASPPPHRIAHPPAGGGDGRRRAAGAGTGPWYRRYTKALGLAASRNAVVLRLAPGWVQCEVSWSIRCQKRTQRSNCFSSHLRRLYFVPQLSQELRRGHTRKVVRRTPISRRARSSTASTKHSIGTIPMRWRLCSRRTRRRDRRRADGRRDQDGLGLIHLRDLIIQR
jgi:hypothetical protein